MLPVWPAGTAEALPALQPFSCAVGRWDSSSQSAAVEGRRGEE